MSIKGPACSKENTLLFDLEKGIGFERVNFDVCVIGAGAAGLVLATALAQRGIRTLLLEAGGRRYEARTQNLYLGEVAGPLYTGLYDGRFRVLGGTTTQWGGQILEPDDFIFRERSWVPGSGWPFPKTELTEYYERALAVEGLSNSPKDVDEIWRALDRPRPDFGDDLISTFSQWCPVTNFAKIYKDSIRYSPLLTVCLHANACEFVLGDDGFTVAGIRCRTLRGHEAQFAASVFVMCMGAIEICRFLLQQAQDRTATPWNRKLIGRHYQDHVSCIAGDIVENNPGRPDIYFDYVSVSGYKFQPKLKLALKAQERLRTLDVCGFVLFSSGEDDDMALAYETYRWLKTRRLRKLSVKRLTHFASHFHKLAWHKVPYARLLQFGAKSAKQNLKLCVNCEQLPLSRGQIALSSERDALGMFRAKVAWRSSEQELHSIRSYVRVLGEAFLRNGLGRIVPHPDLFAGGGEFTSTFRDIFHHIGGTRMATSDRAGVVDTNLRLFGTRNAYVCSSSVFPSAGFVNPTHTVIALALRLADHLQSRICTRQITNWHLGR
jgi:choline dehydrogenase-like flavoprotein